MAIHPTLSSPAGSQGRLTPQQTRAISAWSEQAAAASLQSLTLSDSVSSIAEAVQNTPTRVSALRGASVALSIPLDDPVPAAQTESKSRVKIAVRESDESQQIASVSFRRRETLRRDSLKRREALLKGKDGSRRRQRWENDRLLHNPWAEPPSPSDWAVQPTYPRHNPMPYYLAPLWDVKYAHLSQAKQTSQGAEHEKHRIPKELRMRLKHARAARGMLQDIEEDIRQFIQAWNEKQSLLLDEGLEDAPLSSDEDSEDEVVFVGRKEQMHDSPEHKTRLRELRANINKHNERDGEKMVLESMVDDRAAGFGRWLVHSIASYYGLHTWSVTVGEPARREAYVGFHMPAPGSRPGLTAQSGLPTSCRQDALIKPGDELPRPLWAQI
ncbi:uncharacterized protein ACLA_054180 [Aspergillus clavatus NRRL 1]|uniref:R3H-associated N-terminal domain-containing protein n=1 Tax=Aspergillus clavatus (strain ATCC 1007 / CBS 513.65 / DSM 816 / NCTC 3887 / NRRL 1 / QM 1276 / 107) TaxID=344612 RepID=A1C947_ASPCL|nr:uncharacterized protein ACLA_054180 [Aspergillus clavatus NRRL 1]EAW13371.1 conserved hypothetical protein [Aspergillus clavatus NRRL 1]